MESSFLSHDTEGPSAPSFSPTSPSSPPEPHSLTNAHSFTFAGPTTTAEYVPSHFPRSPSNRREWAAYGVPSPPGAAGHHHRSSGSGEASGSALPAPPSPARFVGGKAVLMNFKGTSSVGNSGGDGAVRWPSDHGGPTPLGSSIAISFSESAVAALRGAPSRSDLSLPDVVETVPQPPLAPPPRRISEMAPIFAPLVVEEGDAALAAAPAASRSRRRTPSATIAATLPSLGGGDASSTAAVNPSISAGAGAVSGALRTTTTVRSPAVYATYNVHPVLRRTAHPLYHRELPSRIGRQTNSNTSISTLFPLSTSQTRPTAGGAFTSPGSSIAAAGGGGGGTSMMGALPDAAPRRGFRFPAAASPQKAVEALITPLRLDDVADTSETGIDLVELLPGAALSTADRAPASAVLEAPPPSATNAAAAATAAPTTVQRRPSVSMVRVPSPPSFSSHGQPQTPPLDTAGPATAAAAAGASSPSSSAYLQGSPSMNFAATTWSTTATLPSLSPLLSPSPLLGAAVSLTSSSLSQMSPQLRAGRQLHLAVPSARPATPSTHPQPGRASSAARAYSRRDIRRGRWILNVAREECEARAALEEAEAYEAIRTLPASCRVWRSYIDPAFNDAYDALGYYLLARAAQSPTRMAISTSADGCAEFFHGDAEEEGDLNGVVEQVQRTLAAAHRSVTDDSEGPLVVHPALLTAANRLAVLETVCREEILRTEAAVFIDTLHRPYVYEHRILTIGTLPLERFVRRWVSSFRARKVLHARQRERLCAAEAAAREGLISSSRSLAARAACQLVAVVAEEHYHRTQLELLHAQDAAWAGVVLTRLREQVELFALLYGGTMRQTRVCGRVDRTTRFRSLVMAEEAGRGVVARTEAAEWRRIPIIIELHFTVACTEPEARGALCQAEAARRAELTQVVHALAVHYTKRDVELREYDERQGLFTRWRARGEGKAPGGAVDDDDEADREALSSGARHAPVRDATNADERSVTLSS